MSKYFIGIDVGTQGVRLALLDLKGNLIGEKEKVFKLTNNSREEQSPLSWWESCLICFKELIKDVIHTINLNDIKAITVTSTSGTVIPIDKSYAPLHNALMYSDQRSKKVSENCQKAAKENVSKGYTGFNSSSGLSKIVWFERMFPNEAKKVFKWIHAADFIIGKLSGVWGVTDYTNALKSGYDLTNNKWPTYLQDKLFVDINLLPQVVSSGRAIGHLDNRLATELGLPNQIIVTSGITDGCASQIASGAMKPGNWNTTIGTTMVIKGVTHKELNDPMDRLYSHRHPSGFWMPGGASNTGADWITDGYYRDLNELNKEADLLLPTKQLSYPLRQNGERFPFVSPIARGFEPNGLSKAMSFTANMEGVAYLERYAYEMIEGLSGEKVKAVFTAGGGSNSDVWLKIRCNVMNLPIYKMKFISGSVGAAILAASNTHFTSIIDAVESLTQVDKVFEPDLDLSLVYNTEFQKFSELLIEKGFIDNN